VLVGTSVALLLGLDETTVGSVAAPTRVPGATVAKTLPIPPPPSKATNSSAMNIGGLYELSNLVIFLSLFEKTGHPCHSRCVGEKGVGTEVRFFLRGRELLCEGTVVNAEIYPLLTMREGEESRLVNKDHFGRNIAGV
jgi:hypothetical protein